MNPKDDVNNDQLQCKVKHLPSHYYTVFSLLKPWVLFKKNFFGVGIIKGKGLFKGGIIF